MAGSLGRKAAIFGWAFLAATGNRYAEGRFQFFKTLERLHGDWARHRGGSGRKPTMRNLYAFMETQYGMEFDSAGNDNSLSAREVDDVFQMLASELVSRGLVALR